MFSVIIPLYNKELSIQNTIQSVLEQTYQDFEIIVIDDGSSDSSAEQVRGIQDSRIKLFQQENQGVSAARNRGIKESKFEWIALLDGDDLWEPNHLEEITKMMRKFPEEKVYVTSFKYSDNRSFFKHTRNDPIFKIENYFKEALYEPLIWTSIIVFHKSCFYSVGGFNELLSRGEDLDLWARLSKKYTIIKSSEVTAVYRTEAENRSNKSFNVKKSRVYHLDLSNTDDRDEYRYYKRSIINSLRGYLLKKRLKVFFLLFKRHKNDINLLDILRY